MPRLFTDQMGRKVELPDRPLRIVSLVPSQTELLHYLGCAERVVGITRFCIHPKEWLQQKVLMGGTKQFKFKEIDELEPDLIIGNKEENYEEGIAQLAATYPVWMSDIVNLNDALEMIVEVGKLVNEEEKAKSLVEKISSGFVKMPKSIEPIKAAYLIWRKPWMAAAKGTFIDDMLQKAGFSNVFSQESRYPEFSLEQLAEKEPQVVLLSSEPYPFKERHIAEIQAVLPNAKVLLVNGELFSWYGSRLLLAPPYFAQLKENLA